MVYIPIILSFSQKYYGVNRRETEVGKFTMSLSEAMESALKEELQRRRLSTIQGTIRSILAEYFREETLGRIQAEGIERANKSIPARERNFLEVYQY